MVGLSELFVLVIVGATFLMPVLAIGAVFFFLRHYRESGALAHDTFSPGRPCRLVVPAGGPLDVMVRLSTVRARGTSEGVTAIVSVMRPPTVTQFAIGLTPAAPQPPSMPFQPSNGVSYLSVKSGRESRRTKLVAHVAAGGAGEIVVDVVGSPGTEIGYLAAFVKASR